jgi:hypothetical protein
LQVLKEKPGTKRPAIVAAATFLFASVGVDATSMRDIADAAGVREATAALSAIRRRDLQVLGGEN